MLTQDEEEHGSPQPDNVIKLSATIFTWESFLFDEPVFLELLTVLSKYSYILIVTPSSNITHCNTVLQSIPTRFNDDRGKRLIDKIGLKANDLRQIAKLKIYQVNKYTGNCLYNDKKHISELRELSRARQINIVGYNDVDSTFAMRLGKSMPEHNISFIKFNQKNFYAVQELREYLINHKSVLS